MEKVPKYRDECHEIGAGKRRKAKHREFEHRALHPVLRHNERDTGDGAQDEERHDPGRGVAGILPLDHAERHTGQERGAEHEPQHVDTAPLAIRRLGDGDGCQDERNGPKSQVEPEDGPPAREADEEATDDGSEGQCKPGHRGPHAERVGAGSPIWVHVPDDGQGAGLAGGRADPHDDAAGNEPIDVPRQSGHDGAATEHGHTDEHDALATEDVPEHPEDQHETGEGQRVAIDDPLQRRDSSVQVALDVGQADADDCVVQEREKEDTAQGGQGQGLGSRTKSALLDVESGRSALASVGASSSLRQQRRRPETDPTPAGRVPQLMHTSFVYPRCG